jgi:RND family efflux transporter MFP subunit
MAAKKALGVVVILVVLVLAAAAFYWKISGTIRERRAGLEYQEEIHDISVRPVTVVKVERMPISSYLELTGTVRPVNAATVSAKVSATIVMFDADEGSIVKEGDIVVELEKDELTAALERAQAELSEAQAAKVGAEADANNARIDWERTEKLYKDGVISKQDLDAQEKARNVAEAKVAQAEAAVKRAEANLENAKVRLDYATIKAPIDGIITEKHQDVGDTTAPGKGLFRLECIRQVKVEAKVIEDDLKYVSQGKEATVRIDALEGKEFKGEVVEVIPSAQPDIRSFTIKVLLDNPERAIKPGMFARVQVAKETQSSALVVPSDCVYVRDGVEYLYVVENDKAHLRRVTLGTASGEMVEVREGVDAGDVVVRSGKEMLEDGAAVKIR